MGGTPALAQTGTDVLSLYGSIPPANAAYQLRLSDTGPTGLSQFKTAVQELGLTIEERQDTSVTLDTATLQKYSVVIFGSNNRTFTSAEQAAMRAFVGQGGGILVFCDGQFGFEEGRASDNNVLQSFNMLMHHDNQAGLFNVSQYTQSHFITNGLTFRGYDVSMIRASAYPATQIAGCQGGNCVLNPVDGTIQSNDSALVIINYGSGRVAATFDCNTFVNGPGTGTCISEVDNRQYAKNLITWLIGHEPRTAPATVTGELKKWHNVTLTFDGPARGESAGTNPFLDYRLEVTFTKGVRQIKVPGYFAANGNAANTSSTYGNKWRVHFVPDETGIWNYSASFRFGRSVAISSDPAAGTAISFNGVGGSFTVGPTDKTGRDHQGKGLLKYVGEHFLRFAETGEFFIKGGADSPENFLAYIQFDGTYDTGGTMYPDYIHQYLSHVGDWREGDPVWQTSKGKHMIGAINYLSGKGMNSIYFLTYNIDGGDGMDVWPWSSPTVRDRFDCSKLDQWEIVFSHMDKMGIQLHVVTQETENDQGLDGGELGNTRKLYYRELVARFAHHLAVVWNLGEENSNTDPQRKAFCDYIRSLDAWDHPIVVHTAPGHWPYVYGPLLGYPSFEGPSIQEDGKHHTYRETTSWVDQSAASGRPWFVCIDEIGPADTGVVPDGDDYWHNDVRSLALWGNLMGGGAGAEWYFGYAYHNNDLNCEDWRTRDHMWDLTRYAIEFFQNYLPFTQMSHRDDLITAADSHCLAKPGDTYAVYLRFGGTANLNLESWTDTFTVHWFNPREGGALQTGSVSQVTGPGWVNIGNPYGPGSTDWAALVRVVPTSVGSIAQLRAQPDGRFVNLSTNLVVSMVSPSEGFFYAQTTDGTAGMRVETGSALPEVGWKVSINGRVGTNANGEKAAKVANYKKTGSAVPAIRGLNNQAIGGQGYTGASDTVNQGLLTRVWGMVTYVAPGGAYFLLDDGSRVDAQLAHPGIKVIDAGVTPTVGQYRSVVGVVTSEMTNGRKIRVLLGRKNAYSGDNATYSM